MPSGLRFGSVRVQAGDYSEVVSVSYNVTPPPGGELNRRTPASVTVSTIERTTAAPVTIEVLGPSWEPQLATGTFIYYGFPFTIEWLQVQPVAGGYRLTANANALNAGTYTATLQISGTDTSVASNIVQVPITITVGPGLITPADATCQSTPTQPWRRPCFTAAFRSLSPLGRRFNGAPPAVTPGWC